jgi:hypothetical protein
MPSLFKPMESRFTHCKSCFGDRLFSGSAASNQIGSSEGELPGGNRKVRISVLGISTSLRGEVSGIAAVYEATPFLRMTSDCESWERDVLHLPVGIFAPYVPPLRLQANDGRLASHQPRRWLSGGFASEPCSGPRRGRISMSRHPRAPLNQTWGFPRMANG